MQLFSAGTLLALIHLLNSLFPIGPCSAVYCSDNHLFMKEKFSRPFFITVNQKREAIDELLAVL
jgi:hypothetical protein